VNDVSLILARVLSVAEDGLRIHLLYANGFTTVIDVDEPTRFKADDVVFVDPLIQELEAAPVELWRQERWIAVVHSIRKDWLLLDIAGRLMPVPVPAGIELSPGATVVGQGQDEILEVLSDRPLRARSLLDRDDDENPIEEFKDKTSSGLAFDDFGGLPEVVERARELIDLSLNRGEELAEIGGRPIKGVLFTGDPGTGKTMLARVVAAQSGAAFFKISGPEFLSRWYGESERVLRDVFRTARETGKAIIFIDEIDSIAGQREEDLHEVSWRIVTSLLTEMDGFEPDASVVVIGATNRPDDLDPALRRAGRFDWEIDFRSPDQTDRLEMLRVSGKRVKTEANIPLELIAERTEGWSAADLTGIWSEAALLAVADDRKKVTAEDFAAGFIRVKAVRDRRARRGPDAARAGGEGKPRDNAAGRGG
jgi:transitional endoplasmic reticulum ATPase